MISIHNLLYQNIKFSRTTTSGTMKPNIDFQRSRLFFEQPTKYLNDSWIIWRNISGQILRQLCECAVPAPGVAPLYLHSLHRSPFLKRFKLIAYFLFCFLFECCAPPEEENKWSSWMLKLECLEQSERSSRYLWLHRCD